MHTHTRTHAHAHGIHAFFRYLKWVIKDRHSRGAARIVSVGFETSGEGSLTAVLCPRTLELTVSDRFLSELQGHQAAVVSSEMREARTTGTETHDVVNLTDIEIVVESHVTNTKTIVPPGATVAVTLPPGAAVVRKDPNHVSHRGIKPGCVTPPLVVNSNVLVAIACLAALECH